MSCHNSESWPQRNWNKWTLELKFNYTLKQPRWCWSDHWRPIWRWLIEMTVLFLHVAFLCPPSTPPAFCLWKLLSPWSPVEGELAVGQVSLTRPLPVASIWNKVNFPFHQPGLFIGFWAVGSLISTCSFGNKKVWAFQFFRLSDKYQMLNDEWGGLDNWELFLIAWNVGSTLFYY